MTTDRIRWRYGLIAVVIAVIAVVGAFLWASYRYDTASDVSTALAAITGTVGTILGAYLGFQAGSAGRDDAEQARRDAEQRANDAQLQATGFAAIADPLRGAQLLENLRPGLSRGLAEPDRPALDLADEPTDVGGRTP